MAWFSAENPADDGVLLQVLDGLAHPQLVVDGNLVPEPDGRYMLVGLLRFSGVNHPVREPVHSVMGGGPCYLAMENTSRLTSRRFTRFIPC